jgi:hypothetical protein
MQHDAMVVALKGCKLYRMERAIAMGLLSKDPLRTSMPIAS